MTAASGRQQPPPKLYRPVLSVAGVSTASQGVSPGADVRRDGTGSPLPVAPLTGKVQGAPTPRGIQRAESGAPGIQTVRTEPAKRERNRKGKRSVGPPEVMMPTVDASNDGATPIPRAAAGSLSPGSGHAKLKPNPNSNPNLNPQHSPVTSQPPRRPRAPYNPLARAKPLAPAGPTGQSTFSKATSLPIISPQRKVLAAGDQRAASSFEPSTSGVDMTSAEASADVTPNVPIGPVAQRSPESSSFSPELPSILAMLLPVEGASVNVAPPTSTAPSNVYRSDADRPIPGGVSVASGHLANIDWAGATEMGPSSWGKSPSVQSKSRKASGRKVTKKMATSGGTEKQDRRGNGVCSICFDNPKNGAIIPCGHCLCYECGSMMKERRGECPFCNRKIESVFKIFL